MNINHLIFLVQKKNDLNRKRRRFYYYWTCAEPRPRAYKYYKSPRHISAKEAQAGYKKAQTDMKKMTKMMRQARKEIGAKFVWDDRGAIYAVMHDGVHIGEGNFKRYIEAHHIENILLRSK